jgi:signal recognition particle subunit SRP19
MHRMASEWIQKKNHSDKDRWICIYPAYLNSKKTIAEGRRIPLAKAIENPNYQEIRDVLAAAGLTVGVENKAYSREKSHELNVRGRIRVHFRNDDGSLVNPKFPNRDALMLYAAEMIPKLKSRTNPQGAKPQEQGGKKKGKKK